MKSEHKTLQIKSLCFQLEDDSYSIPRCSEIDSFLPLLIPFAIMNSNFFMNDIFACKWHNFLTSNKGISGTEIQTKVWEPVFAECIELIHNLEHEKISIGEAKKIFGEKEKCEIQQSIKCLLLGIRTCEHTFELGLKNVAVQLSNQNTEVHADEIAKTFAIETTADWIHDITNKISEWCCVQGLSEIADTLMQILENLNLILVDIKHLESFTSQVNFFL